MRRPPPPPPRPAEAIAAARSKFWRWRFFFAGLGVELVEQGMLRCALPARPALQALRHPHEIRDGQCVEAQLTQAVQHGVELVENLDDFLATAATHTKF